METCFGRSRRRLRFLKEAGKLVECGNFFQYAYVPARNIYPCRVLTCDIEVEYSDEVIGQIVPKHVVLRLYLDVDMLVRSHVTRRDLTQHCTKHCIVNIVSSCININRLVLFCQSPPSCSMLHVGECHANPVPEIELSHLSFPSCSLSQASGWSVATASTSIHEITTRALDASCAEGQQPRFALIREILCDGGQLHWQYPSSTDK